VRLHPLVVLLDPANQQLGLRPDESIGVAAHPLQDLQAELLLGPRAQHFHKPQKRVYGRALITLPQEHAFDARIHPAGDLEDAFRLFGGDLRAVQQQVFGESIAAQERHHRLRCRIRLLFNDFERAGERKSLLVLRESLCQETYCLADVVLGRPERSVDENCVCHLPLFNRFIGGRGGDAETSTGYAGSFSII
jgi:hypothetical protein